MEPIQAQGTGELVLPAEAHCPCVLISKVSTAGKGAACPFTLLPIAVSRCAHFRHPSQQANSKGQGKLSSKALRPGKRTKRQDSRKLTSSTLPCPGHHHNILPHPHATSTPHRAAKYSKQKYSMPSAWRTPWTESMGSQSGTQLSNLHFQVSQLNLHSRYTAKTFSMSHAISGLQHCRQILYHLSYQGSPMLETDSF